MPRMRSVALANPACVPSGYTYARSNDRRRNVREFRLNFLQDRDYTEIHTGDVVKLGSKYRDKTLTPQTISHTIWKHFLHPEDKSLGPDGEACNEYTRGLLKRRPVLAMLPFEYIGKEVERKGQEGEDPSILERGGPIRYGAGRKAKTRSADPALIEKARR
jgi:hypothetical protein